MSTGGPAPSPDDPGREEGDDTPLASVIVPTRDRPVGLRSCLRALAQQTEPRFEVVVVDDGSRDAAAVAAVVGDEPRARLVRADGGGPAAARNRGAAAARAPVLLFTDDDCRPAPGWVAAMLERIDGGAAAAAGPTRNGDSANPFAAASQVITNHLSASSLDPATGTLGFAPTSNVACRADVHHAVPFDDAFPLAAGEDRDWCDRLTAAGHPLHAAPEAVVWHHQELPARAFWRQQLRYGRGAWHWRRRSGGGRQRGRFYVDLVRRGFAEGPLVGVLVLVAQLATAIGLASEALGSRRRRT